MKARLCGLCAFLSLAIVPGRAQAEETESVTARLEWRRSRAGCIDAGSLAAEVNARWGRPVFVDQGSTDLVLSGDVGRSEHGYSATIELKRVGGASLGSRRLETKSKDCRALDDSVALAVGLMLDVSRARVVEERREQQAAKDAVAAEATKPRPDEPAPPPEPVFVGPPIAVPPERSHARPFTFEPWVGGELAIGLLSAPSFGGRAGVSLEPPGFARLDVGASWFLPVDERADEARGVRLSALAVDLGLCVDEWESDTLRLHVCVIERVGRVRASGLGLSEPVTASELLFNAGIRQVGTLRLGRLFSLRLAASLEVPLVRYRFVFDDIDHERQVAYEMNQLSGALEFGLALRLP
jgi:hypothetical protein